MPRRVRTWAWLLILGLVGLGLALTALPWALSGWIDRALRAELASRGIHAVRIDEIQVGLGETVVEGLVLGDAELIVPRIRASYALTDLLRGGVAELKIEGIRAHRRLGDAASAGVLERLAGSAFGGSDADAAPRFRGLEVSDLRLALRTPAAEIGVAIEGRFDRGDGQWIGELRARIWSEPDRLHGTARLSTRPQDPGIDVALAGGGMEVAGMSLEPFALSLDGRIADGRVDGTLDLDASARSALGPVALSLASRFEAELAARRLTLRDREPRPSHLLLPELGLRFSGISADLSLEEEAPQIRIQIVETRDLHDAARFTPLALDASLVGGAQRLRGNGTLTGAGRRLVVRFDGIHDFTAEEGNVHLHLAPIEFAASGLQPGDVSPLLAGLELTGGSIAAEGRVSWGEAALRSALTFALRDLAGRASSVDFEGLEARLKLIGPPLATPPGQTLEVARAKLGLDAEQVEILFTWQPPGVLDVESAQARLLGGTLKARGRFDPALERNAFVLDLSGVDLGELASSLRLEGLSVSGGLSGSVPLALQDGALFIEEGQLAATGDGVLQYQPTAEAPLSTGDTRVRLLLDALRDFHYDQLRITLNGALSGELDIGVHLAGSSPSFYEGKAVEFNLDLEAPISALLRDLDPEALPERILRELRQRELP